MCQILKNTKKQSFADENCFNSSIILLYSNRANILPIVASEMYLQFAYNKYFTYVSTF